jgi:hypothetical protein
MALMQAGWDAAAADPRHCSVVVAGMPPDTRPPAHDLVWFRLGFARQRDGDPRPCDTARQPSAATSARR